MFRNLLGARLPRLALHTLLLALPFAAILAEPALAQNLDLGVMCKRVPPGLQSFRLMWPDDHRGIRTGGP